MEPSQDASLCEPELSGSDSLKLDLYFWLQALVMALIALILVFTFLGRVVGVDGDSMVPTLHDGDMILLQSAGYTPRQNDVIVLTKPFGPFRGPIVKRVIAVGGQTVEIDYAAGTVLVDGLPPRQNDVIVLTKPFGPFRGPIVKRVIAVGGQTVEIDYAAGTVLVDGLPLEEPYLNEVMCAPSDPHETISSATVPEGCLFVMGDNRNHSSDSRDERLGVVDARYVLGRATAVLLPLSHAGAIS